MTDYQNFENLEAVGELQLEVEQKQIFAQYWFWALFLRMGTN